MTGRQTERDTKLAGTGAENSTTTKRRWPKRLLFSAAALLLAGAILMVLFFEGILRPNLLAANRYEVRGVDVSEYQGAISWPTLAAQDIDFAFIKATEGGSYIDPYFAQNWDAAQDTGLITGAYHFFSFDSPGLGQAVHFMGVVPQDTGMLPPVVDIELYGQHKSSPPAYEEVAPQLQTLLDMLEQHYGVRPILYATGRAYRLYLAQEFTDYPLWIRNVYGTSGTDWAFWQYSDRGRMDGYEGPERFIDLNVFHGSYDELLQMTTR